jgi:hypothetical protein
MRLNSRAFEIHRRLPLRRLRRHLPLAGEDCGGEGPPRIIATSPILPRQGEVAGAA